ncbi:UrcA family protein [Sphingomicrobium astaxanthinifaciens]|uniref:UrcA family protein n=1 Tax=Sphingomicrobium astaxanthinifaciens TaxID=1227949 RepID=UPI001FCC891F|nr:UrcA family protein [Sphingomicrobium astaxanthinifaciens]MCJ7421923.1 UrcA family protein [Sphingomicrobium astaxanthinifaciens]
MVKFLPLLAATGLAASLLGAAALAEKPVTIIAEADAPRATVYIGDLEPSSDAGRDAIRARVRSAARDLCGPHGRQSIEIWSDRRRCYATARNDGYRQADALHELRRGSVIVEAMTIVGRIR